MSVEGCRAARLTGWLAAPGAGTSPIAGNPAFAQLQVPPPLSALRTNGLIQPALPQLIPCRISLATQEQLRPIQ